MLLIETRLGPSQIQGIGLFAAQPIKAGAEIWRMDQRIDLTFTAAAIEKIPSVAAAFLHRYGYFCIRCARWVLCGDDARFFNHSASPNTEPVLNACACDGVDIATRDIAAGEELTTNYEGFDAMWRQKLVV